MAPVAKAAVDRIDRPEISPPLALRRGAWRREELSIQELSHPLESVAQIIGAQ
jgi:hypothetical protein